MKGAIYLASAVAAVAGVSAQPHQHQHQHLHAKKHEHAAAEKRDAVTVTTVVPATVTQYVLDGKLVDITDAEGGIKDGHYIVVGSSSPTFTPPAPSPTSTSISTSTSAAVSSSSQGAQFIEIKSSSAASSSASATSKAAAASASASSSSSTGNWPDFPSGKVACSAFPSKYGAVGVSWLGTGQWIGLQSTGSWTPGLAISNIVTAITGGCEPGMFCSYACPAGYQKTQWPATSQGSTGQSIGGLWCNDDGMLELTRTDYPQLCEAGVGGITIVNNLSQNVAVCRTDYPGLEAMTIPIDTQPGGSYPLTNPNSNTYYVWEGKPTTAQYYVNPAGVAVEDACVWNSATNPTSAGNWAPTNIGTGQSADGNTYLSIFPNTPTSSAVLNFNIKITGDNNGECYLEKGSYYGGGNGCTTAFASGGKVTITFYD